jgi:hypothetical protein
MDYFTLIFIVIILMQTNGVKCIAREADLTCQLLRRGADPVDHYLFDQGREVCMCALSLMNCASDSSVAASAVMLVNACLKKIT